MEIFSLTSSNIVTSLARRDWKEMIAADSAIDDRSTVPKIIHQFRASPFIFGQMQIQLFFNRKLKYSNVRYPSEYTFLRIRSRIQREFLEIKITLINWCTCCSRKYSKTLYENIMYDILSNTVERSS